MTDTPTDAALDASIAEKQQHIETIINHLEDSAVSLERAKDLHQEGTALIEALEDELALGDGEVRELS